MSLAAILVVLGCGGGQTPSPDPLRPDVVLITLDTVRADRLGVYGGPPGLTPNLDRFAERATLFERCVAAAATTVPSHASMLTGLYARRHGALENRDVLGADLATLPAMLERSGYATASFVSTSWLDAAVAESFGYRYRPGPARGGRSDAAEVTRAFADWLPSVEGRPVFAWLHYFEPHPPWTPSATARSLMGPYRGPFAEGISIETFNLTPQRWMAEEEDRRAVEALYGGSIHSTDAAVGEVFDLLVRSGRAETAFVVVAADHGLDLGDHGSGGHGGMLWESVVRVPLLIRDGLSSPPGTGAPHRVRTPVSLVDLVPTILERLALEIPADLAGRSLMPALRHEPLVTTTLYAEADRPRLGPEPPGGSHRLAVVEGEHKLILTAEEYRLFDLGVDAGERGPTLEDEAESERLRRLAAAFLQSPARASERRNESADDLRSLEALGYVARDPSSPR